MWAGSLGWLGMREAASHAAPDLAAGTERLPPGAAYFAVRLAERQIGLASLTIDTLGDGIRITERLDLSLPAGDRRRVVTTADAELSLDLRLRRFTTTWTGTAERLRAVGTVEGDSVLVIETASGAAEPDRVRIPLRDVLTTSAAAPLRLAFGSGFAGGRSADMLELDPIRLVLRELRLSVTAESVLVVADSAGLDPVSGEWIPASLDTVAAWRLVDHDGAGVRWVDASGYVVAATTVEGLALERSAFEIVNGSYRNADPDVRWDRGLQPRGALARPPARGSLVALLADSGFSRAGDPAIGGGVRRWVGDTVAPGGIDAGANGVRPGMAARLAGPFVPSNDPRIAAQARRIIGNAPSSAAAATALAEWVARTIRLDPAGPAGAVAALAERRGTAQAQAALLVALARSANLPARLAGGVAAGTDGRWYRHTWAELYLDRWTPADPAFGRYPADAAYVRLVTDRPGHVLAVDPPAARLTPLHDRQ